MTAIRYDFIQTGADAIENAFLRIGTAAERSEQQAGAAFRGLAAGSRRAANDTETALQGAARRSAEAEKKAAAEGSRARAQAATAAEREAARKGAAAQKAADREVAANRRAEEQKRKDKEREREREYRDAVRYAERIAREEEHAAKRSAERRAAVHRQAKARVSAEGRESLARTVSGVKGVAGTAVFGGGAVATAAIVAATRDAAKLQETAARIAINARQAGKDAVDPTTLRREFEATAIATPGIAAADVADAVQRFISLTGDMDTARRGQRVFATVASATGASVGDVAETAASISQQFNIKDIEKLKEVLAALTFQGKAGSFELKDAAARYQSLAASGAAFGLEKSVQGVKTLGGLTQIARTSKGSGAEAATAIQSLFAHLMANTDKLKAQGVDVYRDGKTRDVRDIIVEMISKVGGTDIAAKQSGLKKLLDIEGLAAINTLVSQYNDTYRNAKGSTKERQQAAMAATRGRIDESVNAAGDWSEITKDALSAQALGSARLAAAFERVKSAAGDQLLPALLQLEPTIPKFTEALVATIPLVKSMGDVAGGVAKLLGGFSLSGGDSAERAREAGMKVAELESAAKTRALTAPEQAQLREAKKNQITAGREAAFISEMVKADTSPHKTATDKEIDAKAYWDKLQKNPQEAAAYASRMAEHGLTLPFMVSGQNEAQAGIVQREAERIKGERRAGGEPEVQEVAKAQSGLAAFVTSLASATRAVDQFNAQQRPHILQGG